MMSKERGEQCFSSVTGDDFERRKMGDIQRVVRGQRVFVGYCSKGEGADGVDALPLFAALTAATPNHIYMAAILTTPFRKINWC